MLHISLPAETLFTILGFPVTNTMVTAWVVMAIICAVAWAVSRTMKTVTVGGAGDTEATKSPGRIAVLVEMVVGGLLNFLAMIGGGEERARRYFPIVATIFIFVLVSNWFGIVPGIGSIIVEQMHNGEVSAVPVLRTVFSDLNMTLALAFIAVIMSHVIGVRSLGLGHVQKYISFKSPVAFFVGILEFIGEIAKIVSFSFRLFGNIFAGEVLLVIIAFLVPIVLPIPFMGLELFVGVIQALIFAVLTMIFFASAEEHAEH
ncbi:MAG: F0F1 ATP synthase subunit A [Candidatus Campbellbacteria bacterium]|nr:F0F1 ATP synthase subunit A [Candidatus Campbellbacteria bacterium]